MSATITSAMTKIEHLRMLLTSNYEHSNTLRNNIFKNDEAHFEMRRERDAAIAELACLTAAAVISSPAPPLPAIASSDRTLDQPF